MVIQTRFAEISFDEIGEVKDSAIPQNTNYRPYA